MGKRPKQVTQVLSMLSIQVHPKLLQVDCSIASWAARTVTLEARQRLFHVFLQRQKMSNWTRSRQSPFWPQEWNCRTLIFCRSLASGTIPWKRNSQRYLLMIVELVLHKLKEPCLANLGNVRVPSRKNAPPLAVPGQPHWLHLRMLP